MSYARLDRLNAEYNELQRKYNDLKAKYDALVGAEDAAAPIIWHADLDESTRLEYFEPDDKGDLPGLLHLDDGSIVTMDLNREQARLLYLSLRQYYATPEEVFPMADERP